MKLSTITYEERTILTRRIAKLMSEILSDQFDAKITIVLKEDDNDVPSVPTDTVQSTVS